MLSSRLRYFRCYLLKKSRTFRYYFHLHLNFKDTVKERNGLLEVGGGSIWMKKEANSFETVVVFCYHISGEEKRLYSFKEGRNSPQVLFFFQVPQTNFILRKECWNQKSGDIIFSGNFENVPHSLHQLSKLFPLLFFSISS